LNRTEFISLIEQPELLTKPRIAVLKQVASDFPYFQVAQVLLTKGLYNEQHYEYEKILKHTAVMVPDRAVLFRYIHGIVEEQVVVEQPQVVETTAVGSAKEETQPEIAPIIEFRLPQETIEVPVNEQAVVEVSEEPETFQDAEDLMQTVDAALEETNEQIVPVLQTPLPEEELAPIEPAVPAIGETHSFAEWLQLQIQKPLDLRATAIEPQEELMAPEPTVTEQAITESESQPETVPVVNITEDEVSLLPPVINEREMRIEIQQQVERSNINDFESILDKFIRENPRISRGKAEFYNPVNMAKQSVEEDEELVTETLANVYYKQGHYKKAIRAYEKLCLIYPHKMPYFAGLIQKIKTEIKD
jgi:tetratricopeptide (TPR) repeat protein